MVVPSVSESIYSVVAYLSGNEEPTAFHVNAESPEAAEEQVRLDDAVESVLSEMTEEFSGVYRVEFSGSPDEITDALNHLDHLADSVDADMDIEDVTPTVWPAGDDLDDEHAIRAEVSDWDDVELRVIGSDVGDEHGVLSASAASMQAHEDSTVEVVVGNKVVAQATHEEQSNKQLEVSDGRD